MPKIALKSTKNRTKSTLLAKTRSDEVKRPINFGTKVPRGVTGREKAEITTSWLCPSS